MKRSSDGQPIKMLVFILVCLIIIGCSVKGIMDITRYFGHHLAGYLIALAYLILTIALLVMAFYLLNLSIRNQTTFWRLSDLTDKMNMFAVLWSEDLEMVHCNTLFTIATGYTSADLKDREILRKIFPDETFEISENDRFLNDYNSTFSIESKHGENILVAWSTSEMFRNKADGMTYYISVSHNLNDREKLKNELLDYSAKLEQSEQRYALTMKLTEIGVLLRYSNEVDFYTNYNLRSMLGFPDDKQYVTKEELIEKVHPADRFLAEHFANLQRPSSDNDDVHSIEFRAVSADGDYHWYNFRYKVIESSGVYIKGAVLIDITNDKQKDLTIEKMAYIDELTQIGNRNRFITIGQEVLTASQDSGADYWVIVLDIDEIHLINDLCGYQTGNELLKKIALITMASMPEGSWNARLGGDNFALLIKCNENDDLPEKVLQKIQSQISLIKGSGLEQQNITLSAGYCKLSDSDGKDFTKVLDLAELALNNSDGIKNTYVRYTNELRRNSVNTSKIERQIEIALENNEFVLYYQPKISLSDGSIIGMEALIRWIKPDGSVVPPVEFIPIAEKSMMITKISNFVLKEACRQNKKWQDEGLAPVTVSINLSAIDFYKTDVTRIISDTLEETGLAPEYLDVELTESIALRDINHAIEQMNEIRRLGVRISMDDFGTGYSSLSYIQKLPITLLKLDRSFVMFLETDAISREIVSAVVKIAKSKKIDTIAEGIESQQQADILRSSGCDYAQGYFFGKPMPAEQFREFLIQKSNKTENK